MSRASVFVWLVWAAMTIGVVWFVAAHTADIPFADDWDLVPTLTGHRPATAAWLWEQHYEHRIPLPKVIHLGLDRLTGGDSRAGMAVNVLVLSLLAAGMIVAARRVRGSTSYEDVFFPLLLLHWGQSQNLLWSFQIQFVSSVGLAGVVLIVAATVRGPLAPGAAAVAGLAVAMLPLAGANGLALVPALACWLLFAAVLSWRAGDARGRWAAVLAGAGVVAAGLLSLAYFRDLQPLSGPAASRSMRATVEMAVRFLGMAPGSIGRLFGSLPGVLVLALAFGTMWYLVRSSRQRPETRTQAFGMVALILGIGCLAVGVAWGRAGMYQQSDFLDRQTRYVTLAAPILASVYLASITARRRLVSIGLVCLTALLLIPNALSGLDHAHRRADLMRRIMSDVQQGLTPQALGHKYSTEVFYVGEYGEELGRRFEMLREARRGPYKETTAP